MLVVLYFIVSMIGTVIIIGSLHRNIGGFFSLIDSFGSLGIGSLVTALWTYLVKDDYFRDREGRKKKMDTVNEFFFISMEIWSYIFAVAGLISIGISIVNYVNAT